LLDRGISNPAATDSSIKDMIKTVSNLPHESLIEVHLMPNIRRDGNRRSGQL
jgi:hypothetical protein